MHNVCGDECDGFEVDEILIGNKLIPLPLLQTDGMSYMCPEERHEWQEDRKLIKEFNDTYYCRKKLLINIVKKTMGYNKNYQKHQTNDPNFFCKNRFVG